MVAEAPTYVVHMCYSMDCVIILGKRILGVRTLTSSKETSLRCGQCGKEEKECLRKAQCQDLEMVKHLGEIITLEEILARKEKIVIV